MDFEDVYSKHFAAVYKYIRRLSNSEHIAEEITSETFFKALRTIDDFRGECDLRVWLCQIAKNCYFNYIKKNKRIVLTDKNHLVESNSSLEEQLEDKIYAARIRDLLHDIPEPYKEVFMWRVFAELSYKQIGQIFGKTDNWACVTYHRAKIMLKERMNDENDD